MGRRLVDHTGRRFGRFVALEYAGGFRWRVRCDCGAETTAETAKLVRGLATHCGCAHVAGHKKHERHGLSRTSAYRVWCHIIGRCTNPRDAGWSYYGGRGIAVCERWRGSFLAFLEDMGSPPVGHEIDRIDNDGPYSRENCRWVNRITQMNNKRSNRLVAFQGRRLSIAQWSRELGISADLIYARLDRLGWPVERALSEPARRLGRSS